MKYSKEHLEEIVCKALYRFSSGVEQNDLVLREESYFLFAQHLAAILSFEPEDENLAEDFEDLVVF